MRDIHSSFCFRWFREVWNNNTKETPESNEKAIAAIHELVAPDAIVHGVTEQHHLRGPEAFMAFYTDFRSKYSNITIEVEDVISQDDCEAARCTVRATENESGKNIEFSGVGTVRIQKGKITEAWNNFDFLQMYRQLGYQLVKPQAES